MNAVVKSFFSAALIILFLSSQATGRGVGESRGGERESAGREGESRGGQREFSGREGELIFRYIYEAAGCDKPVRRLWISSLTPDAIRDGFALMVACFREGLSYRFCRLFGRCPKPYSVDVKEA